MANKLTDSDQKLVADKFLALYRDLKRARTPMEKAVADYRNVRNRMKNEGVDLTALGILEKLAKLDEDEAALVIRNMCRYSTWADVPIGINQGSLLAPTDDPQPSEDAKTQLREAEAEAEGYRAGYKGQDFTTNPHVPGSASHAAWGRAWHRGQSDLGNDAFAPANENGGDAEGSQDDASAEGGATAQARGRRRNNKPPKAPAAARTTRRTRNADAQAGGQNA